MQYIFTHQPLLEAAGGAVGWMVAQRWGRGGGLISQQNNSAARPPIESSLLRGATVNLDGKFCSSYYVHANTKLNPSENIYETSEHIYF